MPKYIAKQSIGHFMPGDEIKGLDEKRIQALLASGVIAEPVEVVTVSDSGQELNALQEEVTDLKAQNKVLEDEKVVSAKEVTDLKAKVAELEKSLIASEKKLAAEIKKTATPEK